MPSPLDPAGCWVRLFRGKEKAEADFPRADPHRSMVHSRISEFYNSLGMMRSVD